MNSEVYTLYVLLFCWRCDAHVSNPLTTDKNGLERLISQTLTVVRQKRNTIVFSPAIYFKISAVRAVLNIKKVYLDPLFEMSG